MLGAALPVIEKHGGYVDKYIGDAVMVLFGAPLAHEDDPERAVRARSPSIRHFVMTAFDSGSASTPVRSSWAPCPTAATRTTPRWATPSTRPAGSTR